MIENAPIVVELLGIMLQITRLTGEDLLSDKHPEHMPNKRHL
jgi:hypothetical protein